MREEDSDSAILCDGPKKEGLMSDKHGNEQKPYSLEYIYDDRFILLPALSKYELNDMLRELVRTDDKLQAVVVRHWGEDVPFEQIWQERKNGIRSYDVGKKWKYKVKASFLIK